MDREIYTLKVYSTRMEYDSFQLELTPKENEEANDYYGMNFNVTVWCRGQMCAKLWGGGSSFGGSLQRMSGALCPGGAVAKYTGLLRLHSGRVCDASV